MKGGRGDRNPQIGNCHFFCLCLRALVVVIFIMVVFVMVVFVFAHCHNIYGIAPCGAKHVIETAAYAHISLSAVVQKVSLEL